MKSVAQNSNEKLLNLLHRPTASLLLWEFVNYIFPLRKQELASMHVYQYYIY